jgi:hypothetical protein
MLMGELIDQIKTRAGVADRIAGDDERVLRLRQK